jgi:hypothetical protein
LRTAYEQALIFAPMDQDPQEPPASANDRQFDQTGEEEASSTAKSAEPLPTSDARMPESSAIDDPFPTPAFLDEPAREPASPVLATEVVGAGAQAHAEEAMRRLAATYSQREAIADAATILARILDTPWLDTLEASELFEQQLLTWIFSTPPRIDMLDAAADRFHWETASRHLQSNLPDLAWRLQRHLELRMAIKSLGSQGKMLVRAMASIESRGNDNPPRLDPDEYSFAAGALDYLSSEFLAELQERYGDRMTVFKALLQEQDDRKYAALRNAKPRETRVFNPLLALLAVFAVVLVLVIAYRAPVPSEHYIPKGCPQTDKERKLRQSFDEVLPANCPPLEKQN